MLTRRSFPPIHGQFGATAATLDDCILIDGHGSIGGLTTARLLVQRALIGAWFDEGEAVQFSAIEASMDWLPHWVVKSGIEISHTLNSADPTEPVATIGLTEVEPGQWPVPRTTEYGSGRSSSCSCTPAMIAQNS